MSDAVDITVHPELALAPSYALGALDAEECATFEAHLATCADCRAEVRAHRDVAALLPLALGDAPSASLRDRILAIPAAHPASKTPRPAPADEPASTAARPDVVSIASAPSARRGGRAWPGWLAAAAALLLAVGLGMRWRDERGARQVAEGALAEERATRIARDSLLATVLAPDVRSARLVATGAGPEVRMVWSRRRGVVILTAQGLAPAPDGRTYQLWGIPKGGAPRSLGVFAADANGVARVELRVPSDAVIDVAAISVEPAGGSPAPTTTPVLVGNVSAE